MAVPLFRHKKQHWIAGIACCAMVGMAITNLTVTGSLLPFPSAHPLTNGQDVAHEAPVPQAGANEAQAVDSSRQASAPAPQAAVPQQAAYASAPPASGGAAGPQVVPVEAAMAPAPAAKPAAKPEASGAAATPTASVKLAALTFDDGPDEKYTPQVLDILRTFGVKATFFVVGLQAGKYPEMVKRIHEEGHALGNHSWDHADLSKATPAKLHQELSQTDALLRRTLGETPALVRAPYGAVSDTLKATLAEANRPLVGWTVDPRDWAGTAPDQIVRNVKEHTKPGGIILLHSFGGKNGNLDNTIEALPLIIRQLQSDGYSLVTVPELLRQRK